MGEGQITVWIDRGTLAIETRVGRSTALRELPEAASALRHLVEADCRVVLLGADGPGDTPAGVESTDSLPPDASGWLLTNDPDRCAEVRGRRLRTILIGPSDPARGLAHRASDLEARGLVDAVLVILAADAMPDAGVPARP
jgi:hypothetical protein